MVRHYKHKSNRASYTQEKVMNALRDIKGGAMTTNKASKVYRIPRPTLIKRMRKPDGYCPSSLGRFKPVSIKSTSTN